MEVNAKQDNNPVQIKAIFKYPSGDVRLFTKTKAEARWALDNRAIWTHLADPVFVTSPTTYPVIAQSCPTFLDFNDEICTKAFLKQNEIPKDKVSCIQWLGHPKEEEKSHGSQLTDKTMAQQLLWGGSFLMAHSCRACPTPQDHINVSIASKWAIKLINAKMTQPASNAEGTACPKTARTQLTFHLSRYVYNVLIKIFNSKAPPTNMKIITDTPASVNVAPFDKRRPNLMASENPHSTTNPVTPTSSNKPDHMITHPLLNFTFFQLHCHNRYDSTMRIMNTKLTHMAVLL
ncbi:hypothetical protein O181_096563 [Austropuccinia psidii MF-1]|uniref:Uncharacterized protein n=1 Tax=Austropuccinia psidii MF-1 TaxID=1389203 RepID=A0A9Q3PCA7_9BASI|nr:hypothetical protein [Austropuccinia psidii MF-1]